MDWSTYETGYYYIYIWDFQSVAKHCSVVHESVSFLDLALCKNTPSKSENSKLENRDGLLDNQTLNKLKFFCTEEGSKKSLLKNRGVLYVYHLDISDGLEDYDGKIKERCVKSSNDILSNRCFVPASLYQGQIHRWIVSTLEKTRDVKLVKKVLKVIMSIKLPGSKIGKLNRCLEFLFSLCPETEFDQFSIIAPLEEKDVLFLRPRILEFFIRRSDCKDCNDKEYHRRQEWIHNLICSCQYDKAAILLKFYNAPRFSETAYDKMKHSVKIGSGLTLSEMEGPVMEGWVSKERNLLILQVLDGFYSLLLYDWNDSRFQNRGFETLKMVWSSIPDNLISLEELQLLYGETTIREDIGRIYRFYSNIVEENTPGHRPRKLKDQCRLVIRTILAENQRLPDGISKLRLSPLEQSFLTLERTWL